MNYSKAKYFGALFVLVLLVYFLSKVFSGFFILPQTFGFGSLVIHYYGLIMAAAVGAAFYLALKRAKEFGIEAKQAEDLLFWLIIGGFIGARLYHVFSSFSFYYANPGDIIKVWNGGLSIYGAVIGGLITLWIYRRLSTTHFSLLTTLDWLAPSLALGQIIGRFGNLFNYEAFGYPTALPWKMFVPLQFRPLGFGSFSFFHPFFLYEVLGSCVILFLLLKVINEKKIDSASSANSYSGRLFFLYLLLYNALRFCLEFLRIDSTFIYGIRLNAAVSLLLVIFSGLALIFITKMANAKTP